MSGAAGLVAVLGVLMVAYYFILGRRRGIGNVLDDRGHPITSGDFGGSTAAFLEGLIAVFAMAELAAAGGNRAGSFGAGAFVGALAAAGLVARRWWPGRLGYELFYSVLGLAASVPAISRLFGATGCDTGVGQTVRVVAAVVMLALWAAMLIGALVFQAMAGWRTTAPGLALFGALDVIIFMSGPIGAGVAPGAAVWIVLGAAVVGGLSGLATNLVMMVCGLFLGALQFVSVTTGFSAECDALVSSVPAVMLAGYAVVYWLGAVLVSRRQLRATGVFGRG